ncbi:hypothetical protein GDO78_015747 [Eleutherodactylus coqui]|uniref:Uncharacterized protein n=1 Tax=Eleutherodactylus coqui TaxID=57060 RepID=A0A8J6BER6_ELECQ|nr:hypothetical protein GDO78_015747 [Eleutherodactylus coqui]
MDFLAKSKRVEFSSRHLFSSFMTSALLAFFRRPETPEGRFIVLSTENATPGCAPPASFFPSLPSFTLVLRSLMSFAGPPEALESFSRSLTVVSPLGSLSLGSLSFPILPLIMID